MYASEIDLTKDLNSKFESKFGLLFQDFEKICMRAELNPVSIAAFAKEPDWEPANSKPGSEKQNYSWNKFIEYVAWLRLSTRPVKNSEKTGFVCVVSVASSLDPEDRNSVHEEITETISMLMNRPYATKLMRVGEYELDPETKTNSSGAIVRMTPAGLDDRLVTYGIIEGTDIVWHSLIAVPEWMGEASE